MTDIKDKLEQFKRERQRRLRSTPVEETWKKLAEEKDLTVKEKLERLINLTEKKKSERPSPPKPQYEAEERVPFNCSENEYSLEARYGKITIKDGLKINSDTLVFLSGDPEFSGLDLSTSLLIDLETTGLSGGTGTIPFNIGMGYYSGEKFWVRQYFLGQPAAEEQMIQDLARFLKDMDFQSIITYNGKAFDIPLLETRFILHREPFRLNSLPHLDFLFPARRLWKHKLESCRLYHLAQEVVRTGRTEDIPSAEIPWRYFQYLQTGDFDLIEPVLYHNAEDILSLLGVVIVGASIFAEDAEEYLADAMDFFGAGKVLEVTGNKERSLEFYQRALNGSLTDHVLVQAKKKLADHYKRCHEWDKAISLWKEIASLNNPSAEHLFSFRELAMYFEHVEAKYEEAHRFAEEGYVLSLSLSSFYERDFSHRISRIKSKIKGKEGKP
ncbi:MAG: ribonuclease H-like domain-containing protein [Candidatus Aminicenantes bacterium]|nr:ribonuclease H-like domain-containing protein [Candidatus Aminicenantes bacterium]